MRVSDVVQHADLSIWAEMALVLFVGSFVVVAVRALRADRTHSDSMAGIPLDDGDIDPGMEGGAR